MVTYARENDGKLLRHLRRMMKVNCQSLHHVMIPTLQKNLPSHFFCISIDSVVRTFDSFAFLHSSLSGFYFCATQLTQDVSRVEDSLSSLTRLECYHKSFFIFHTLQVFFNIASLSSSLSMSSSLLRMIFRFISIINTI